jgi:hypothetical protein
MAGASARDNAVGTRPGQGGRPSGGAVGVGGQGSSEDMDRRDQAGQGTEESRAKPAETSHGAGPDDESGRRAR